MTRIPPSRLTTSSWTRWAACIFFVPSLLAFAAISIAVVRLDLDKIEEFRGKMRGDITRELSRLESSLNARISGNVNLVAGLAATVALEPDMSEVRFAALGRRLFDVESDLHDIALAPDLVIRLIYPLEPNLKALGLDYRTSEKQSAGVLRARETGRVVLSGPVHLVQGGEGLIARYPIFLDNGRGDRVFWGILSAVMELDRLYARSGLLERTLSVDVAIAHEGETEKPFFGKSDVFRSDPVIIPLDLGSDRWVIAATPKHGWEQLPPDILESRIYSGTVLFIIVGLMIWAGILLRQRQTYVAELQLRERQYETLSKRHEAALEASGIGVWEFDEESGQLIWDARMRDLYDIGDGPATYEAWRNALHADDRAVAEREFARALIECSAYTTDFRVITSEGETRHIRAHGRVFRTPRGTSRIVGANWNVSKDIELQAELRAAHQRAKEQNRQLEDAGRSLAHLSLHDALTDLPNRRYFDGFIAEDNARDRIAFLHVDLDRFKDVNDTLGHAAGDEVLQTAAARIKSLLQGDEFVARVGGDEFVIATHGDDARVRALVARVLDTLSRPITLGASQCRIGGSIGVAMRDGTGETLRQLLICADTALYEAKRRGRSRAEFYSRELREKSQTLKRRTEDVSRAIAVQEFFPYFQPQFDAATYKLTGVEVLARWQHPTLGVLTPDKFLDIAADINKVAAVDAMVFEKAILQFMRWTAAGLRVPKLSVNVSAQRLGDEAFIERLSEVRLPGATLAIELLETISFEGESRPLLDNISRIKAFGHEIEIDDFGTGHASIASLLEIAPKRLKIDRKLISPITTVPHQQRLVASMIEIGRSLGIEIVAEGVETLRHGEVLCDLGANTLQGYAFARPMPSDEFMAFARRPVPAPVACQDVWMTATIKNL